MPNTPTEKQEQADELIHMHYQGDPGTAAYVILGVATRDCHLEHVSRWIDVVSGDAGDGIVIGRCPSGSDPATGSNIVTISDAIAVDASGHATLTGKGLSTEANWVRAGDLIVVESVVTATGAATAFHANITDLTIDAQFTTRRK